MESAEAAEARKCRADSEASKQFSAAAIEDLSARSTHTFPFIAFENEQLKLYGSLKHGLGSIEERNWLSFLK